MLTCPLFDAPWADQTGPTSSPQMCIMRCGSCPLKPAVTVNTLEFDHKLGAPDKAFYAALDDLDQQLTQLFRHRHHRDVPRRQLPVAPAFLRSCSLCERTEYRCQHRVDRAGDVGAWQTPGSLARKPDATLEGF